LRRSLRIFIGALTLTITIAAECGEPKAAWRYPAPATAPRPAAIPPPNVITRATQEDAAAAARAASDPAISKAIKDYLGAGAPQWHVAAARDIGDYVLLWIGFPEIVDGGIDLVYSKQNRQVMWRFKGGILG